MPEQKTSFLSIIQNPHFVQLSCFIGVPYTEMFWSSRHPEVPALTLINQMSKLVFHSSGTGFTQEEKIRFIGLFADFASQVVMADLRLSYSVDDMNWLTDVLDSDRAKVTLSMLFAHAAAKEDYFSPGEVAALLGENEQVWRRKAAQHEVPGTIHKSRGWLIPLSGLRAIGLLMDYYPKDEDRDEDENEDHQD